MSELYKKDAIKIWNRRSAPKSDAGMVEALRKIKSALINSKAAIKSAITDEDGLDGGDGELTIKFIDRGLEALASLSKQKNEGGGE